MCPLEVDRPAEGELRHGGAKHGNVNRRSVGGDAKEARHLVINNSETTFHLSQTC